MSVVVKVRRSRLRRMGGCLRSNRRAAAPMLAPDQVQATGNDDTSANVNTARGEHSPYDAIDEDAPQQSCVFERRHNRGWCITERFCEQMLGYRRKYTDGRKQRPVLSTNRNPVRRGEDEGQQG